MKHSLRGLTLFLSMAGVSPALATEKLTESRSVVDHMRGGARVAQYEIDCHCLANPAALGEAPDGTVVRYLTLVGYVSDDSRRSFKEVREFRDNQDGFFFLEKFADRLGKHEYVALGASPVGVRIDSLDISPFLTNDTEFEIRDPSFTQIRARSESRAGVRISKGHQFARGVYGGVALRPMHRWHLDGELAFTEVLGSLPDESKTMSDFFGSSEGNAVGLDVGGLWQIDRIFRLGATVENVGARPRSATRRDRQSSRSRSPWAVLLGTRLRRHGDRTSWSTLPT